MPFSLQASKRLQASKKWFIIFIPFIALLVVFLTLFQGLSLDPRDLASSGPMDKPVPQVRIANLYQWNEFIDSNELQPVSSPIGNWYLLNVWATWCDNCQNEHPLLLDLARQGIVIYGLDYRDTLQAGQHWLKTYGNPFRLVFWDGRGVGVFRWGVYSVPTTFLVDPDGIIKYRQSGVLTKKIWDEKFLPLIATGNKEREPLHQK